ncbi:MAG: hypothetical protein IJI49_00670 [Bacilli bacterium]|nr:hypothetical protein [Bacilli bacterium]
MFNNGFRQEDVDINITNTNQNVNTNMNENMNYNYQMGSMSMGDVMSPVVEPGRERVVNRTFVHEVPHICPINTRIINNHVYKHTYQPRYTCCEENTCTNVQCGSCCCFK